MAFKILYIEDQATESREKDLQALGFDVTTFEPSSDIREILTNIKDDTKALILDYRLTAGAKQACFDAPTIAQTLRSKHSHENGKRSEIPIILMSNEGIITDYYNDFTSQDLFDFTLTKKEFLDAPARFSTKLKSFVSAYNSIIEVDFDIMRILDLKPEFNNMIHQSIKSKLHQFNKNVYEYSNLIYDDIIRSVGTLVGEDILAARLGICKDSNHWNKVLESLSDAKYTGILSDIHDRWWMGLVNVWWNEKVNANLPLRRLSAEERVEVIKSNLGLTDLQPIEKTVFSQSTNYWTICKVSSAAIDPFDGIELHKKDYLPWQEKEYLSLDSALTNIDKYKDFINKVDIKAIRDLANKTKSNG